MAEILRFSTPKQVYTIASTDIGDSYIDELIYRASTIYIVQGAIIIIPGDEMRRSFFDT